MRIPSLLLLAACAPPDAVPEDLDALFHFVWTSYEDDPARLAEAVENLHDAIDGDALADPVRGTVSRLTAEELVVPVEHEVDPDEANGMALLDHLPGCTLDALVPVVTALDQDVKYPGGYDLYARSYTSDADAFFGAAVDRLEWTVYYETSNLLTGPFSSNLSGGVRRVDVVDTRFGAVLLQRSWLHEPAVFESGNRSFTQDYQLEMYWERAPGEMNHALAIWREMDLGAVTSEDDIYVNTVLANLEDWDAQTALLCRGDDA